MVNVRAVQHFYYVARHGGMSEATKHIPYGVGQSALSEQMSLLEDDLHTVLFHRRPFQLTPGGQRLYEFCKPFFDDLDKVATELRNGAPDLVRVAASLVVLQDYLPEILRAVQNAFPKLTFTLRHGPQPQIEEMLATHKVDLVVTVSENKPPPDCGSETLVHLPLVLLVPAGSRLQSANDLWAQDRIADKLIAPSEQDVVTRSFRRGLEQRGVDWNVVIELNSVDVIETFVSQGYGVGLSVFIPGRPRPTGLRELKLEGFPTLDMAMMWSAKPNPVTLALIQELRRKAKQLRKFL